MSELRNRWALVTGASSGLGADFARLLAERGCHVILVARRAERLEALAKEIEAEHGVETWALPEDLGSDEARQRLYDRIVERGVAVDVLVNNAGFGIYGPFTEIDWERERQMLDLDVTALVHLTKLFVKDMVERDVGWVLQVSSIGAFQPSPTYATYSAAKSFVLSFGEALSYELRKTRVKVSVVSPGVTRTEFLEVAGQEPTAFQRLTMMPSLKVAEIGLRGMLRGKPSTVPGVGNAVTAWSLRFVPRRTTAAIANLAMNLR